jgi:hypothetical protein
VASGRVGFSNEIGNAHSIRAGPIFCQRIFGKRGAATTLLPADFARAAACRVLPGASGRRKAFVAGGAKKSNDIGDSS